jgi:hypothetical protein
MKGKSTLDRHRPRWEDDIKVDLQWVQDRVQWQAVVKTKMFLDQFHKDFYGVSKLVSQSVISGDGCCEHGNETIDVKGAVLSEPDDYTCG